MSDLGALALRLSEATDIPTAAERLAEHLQTLAPDAAARVYLLGAGDRCGTCPRAEECFDRERCLHMEAGLGGFARAEVLDQRVPAGSEPWQRVLGADGATVPPEVPAELRAPEGSQDEPAVAVLQPLEAGGETVGVVGVRCRPEDRATVEAEARVGAFLTATAVRLLRTLGTANRRFESLLLVNELGRKVNSILNDELLLKQAAVDIHRTFGFHNVMIFMVDDARQRLELRAQASRYAAPVRVQGRMRTDEGVIGRTFQTGRTEVVDDVSTCPDYVCWYADSKSEMAVPVQIGGVTEGVLNIESDQVGAFTPADRLVLETVANQLAIAIENARLFGMVKEREDRYRTLVESSPGAVFHLDTAGRMIYGNPSASALTGYSKSELLARFQRVEDLAREEDRETLRAAVSDALRGRARERVEFQIGHADASLRSVTASLQPLVSEQGDPKGVVVLARDRTREKQLQDQLNQSEKLSAIGTLVSGVAHELNNPLAGILGFAQLLLVRDPGDWSRTDIENIELNARRCQRIVENLLAFARQSRMTKRRANLNEVIDSVLNLNEYQFRMDNIDIERDFDARVPHFPIDVHRWQQVFINLASNAHQALLQAPAGRRRRIRFSTRRDGDTIEIRIGDNGPGVPREVRQRIFDPFFTTKESGTGLGLGICFGIVEEHGGTITLDDTVEEGATFVIRSPIVDLREYASEIPPGSRRPTSDAGSGKHVLVVDDDTYVCDVVTRVLANHGYEADVAHTGEEALRLLGRRSYDLLVSDVRMPGDYDGIDVHDRLQMRNAEAHRRMVFMTGNLLDGRTMERLQELRVHCVEKPFDIHALADAVNGVATEAGEVPLLSLEPEAADVAPGLGGQGNPGAATG
jgi:two-component system NtrC family sensor kinase